MTEVSSPADTNVAPHWPGPFLRLVQENRDLRALLAEARASGGLDGDQLGSLRRRIDALGLADQPEPEDA